MRDASGWRSLKLFDFGISKFSLTGKFSDVDLAAMRTETMMGTPHYISPEQIRSTRDVDHRTDLWSLGAVMFEVLSGGVLPFREEREVTALIAEVLERPHRSLLDIAPNVPERLAAIVDRCLEKDRDFRYQTAAEVALDLLPLAPARARASVERAVSVMQAAGMMPLNGDMESLRPMPAPHSDRLSSPPAVSEPQAPHSGMRASVMPISLGTPPPMPARRSVDPKSSRAAEAERVAAATAASVQPVVVTRPTPIAEPLPEPSELRGQSRTRRLAWAALLITCGLLAGVFLLARRGEPPDVVGSMPLPVSAAMRVEPAQPASPSPATEASVDPARAAAALSAASAERKPASPKSLSRPAAKAAAPTPPDPPPPPPQNKLELRRER